MKSVALMAYPRTVVGRNGIRKLRRQARIPAVIYGGRNEPQNLEVATKDIENVIHHSTTENVLVDLALAEDPKPQRIALVKDVQHHPLSGKVLHVDFHEVDENEKVVITVPVESSGEAAGVKVSGGVLEHVLFKLKVRALPRDLPEAITVDVSQLQLGQVFHIGDIVPPPGVEILGDKQIPVMSVAASRTEAQETQAGAEEGAVAGIPTTVAEPEMIKEKKEDTGKKKK